MRAEEVAAVLCGDVHGDREREREKFID